jgi:hypothetical protein
MTYTKRLVCLAKSLKHGGVCIAGRELTQDGVGGWIRPVSARPTAELTYLEYRFRDGSSPKLLDVVDVPLCEAAAHGHQSENHLIDGSSGWVWQRRLEFEQLRLLVEDPVQLWSNEDHTSCGVLDCMSAAHTGRYKASLFLLDKPGLRIEVKKGRDGNLGCRGVFEHRGVEYGLSVTDPVAREQYEPMGVGQYGFKGKKHVYVCVSLTEPYGGDGRCHKLIASVITDPPLGFGSSS